MKAISVDNFGGLENINVVDMDVPEPDAHEVLIKVEVAGVIYSDIQMRENDYINPPNLPFVPGREVVGTIVKVGGSVTHLKEGMNVGAFIHTGGYAEYAVAPGATTFPIPDKVSFEKAIVYQTNFPVAYSHYSVSGKVQPDETVLIHAAAGGVGSLMVQIAKKHGNRVIALCSSEEKRQFCLAKGADFAINYREKDYVEEVLKLTDGRGVDVSLNSVGGPTLETDFKAIRNFGRWVIYGYAGGRAALSADAIDDVMHRSQQITITSMYNIMTSAHFIDILNYFQEWMVSEPLDSPTKLYSLDQAAEAQQYVATQKSLGKIALIP